MPCTYCNGALPVGRRLAHKSCMTELKKRDSAGMCLYCGKRKRADRAVTWCRECRAPGAPYLGYPRGRP